MSTTTAACRTGGCGRTSPATESASTPGVPCGRAPWAQALIFDFGGTNLAPRIRLGVRQLIALSSLAVVPLALVPLALVPLVATGFQATYIFWLDVLGAIVVPLWVIVLVDFFWARRGRYERDLFRATGGRYWYGDGVNWRAVGTLAAGTFGYWIIAYALPEVREVVPAALPVGVGVAAAYAVLMRRERDTSQAIGERIAAISATEG